MRTAKAIALSAALMLAASAVSCGNQTVVRSQDGQTEITLSWWGNDARTEYSLEAVERFEQLHPDIKVKCSYSEWSGYEARNRVQMISDTETDVMQINVGWLGTYSADGTGYYDIELLSDYVDLSNFPDEILQYGRMNGVLNAIPIAMNAETVYINKTIYDSYGLDIPQTWDDFFAAAKVMKKDNIYPLSGALKAVWLYSITYAEQVTGKSFFNENSEINFKPEDFEIMINFYKDMVDGDVIPKVEDFNKISLDKGEFAGTVAWVSDAVNYFGKSIDAGAEIIAADYTAFSPEDAGEGWYAKPATLYAISKNTEHPREAAILLDFMLNSSEWAELQGVEKGVPISRSVREYLQEDGQLGGLQFEAALVMEGNDKLRHMDPLIENTSMQDEFLAACNLVIYDKEDSETAAKDLYKTLSESFAMAK